MCFPWVIFRNSIIRDVYSVDSAERIEEKALYKCVIKTKNKQVGKSHLSERIKPHNHCILASIGHRIVLSRLHYNLGITERWDPGHYVIKFIRTLVWITATILMHVRWRNSRRSSGTVSQSVSTVEQRRRRYIPPPPNNVYRQRNSVGFHHPRTHHKRSLKPASLKLFCAAKFIRWHHYWTRIKLGILYWNFRLYSTSLLFIFMFLIALSFIEKWLPKFLN